MHEAMLAHLRGATCDGFICSYGQATINESVVKEVMSKYLRHTDYKWLLDMDSCSVMYLIIVQD